MFVHDRLVIDIRSL